MDLIHSFQGLLSMLERDKVEKVQDMYSPDLHDGNYASCKTPSSISAADMYCYCNQQQHKSPCPYVKILLHAIFFLKTRRSSKNLTRSNSKQHETSTFYPDSFPVASNFVIDREFFSRPGSGGILSEMAATEVGTRQAT